MAKKIEKIIPSKIEKIYSKKMRFDPVFLPFDYEEHKENKVILMKTELSVLRCLRIIENLKRLQDEKGKLKREFQHMLYLSTKYFEKTINEMPTITNTKEIRKIEESGNIDFNNHYEEKLHSLSISGTDTTSLEKELSVIQEKLKKLSNYQ